MSAVSSAIISKAVSTPNILPAGTQYDEVVITYPSPTQEVYVFKFNAVVQGTVTIDYSDSSKENMTHVVRS